MYINKARFFNLLHVHLAFGSFRFSLSGHTCYSIVHIVFNSPLLHPLYLSASSIAFIKRFIFLII